MSRTISLGCPRCDYIRYDLIHISDSCGGLLLRDSGGFVSCKLCGDDMSYDVEITCCNCGHKRDVDLRNLNENHRVAVYQMEVFETIVIF